MPKRRKKGLARIGLIGGGIAIGSFSGIPASFADTATASPTSVGTVTAAATSSTRPAVFPAADGLSEADGSLWTTNGQWGIIAGMASKVIGWTPRPGGGAWEVNANGGVFARGAAHFYGSLVGRGVASPVVAISATPTGSGYWLVTSAGGVFAFGDARFSGAATGYRPASPIVGMAPTPTGSGYWLVTAAGGVFSFGDAAFHGSMAGHAMASPIIGIAATSTGRGYRLVSARGGVFTFGDATFYGSAAGQSPLPTISVTTHGGGYDLVRIDGHISEFRPGVAQATGAVPIPKIEVGAAEAAYAPIQSVADHAASVRAKAVSAAYARLGAPYVYGASGPGAFDCSGLTAYSYAQAGVALPHNTVQQLAATSQVPASRLQPGDLVFFYPGITHVGIYIGNGQMIDAPHVGSVVRIDSMQWFGPVMAATDPAA